MALNSVEKKLDALAIAPTSAGPFPFSHYMLMDIDYISKPNMRMEESQLQNGLLEEVAYPAPVAEPAVSVGDLGGDEAVRPDQREEV